MALPVELTHPVRSPEGSEEGDGGRTRPGPCPGIVNGRPGVSEPLIGTRLEPTDSLIIPVTRDRVH